MAMTFSLFVHMERFDPNQSHDEIYEQFIELCTMADAGGFEMIWVGEHHAMDFTIAPNPFVQIADLAHRTSRVRLGTSSIVAPFWHPIKAAGEAAITDIISGGRLELGIARGAYSFEYERLLPGLDAKEAGLRMRELVPTLRPLWAGNYTHDGHYWKFPKSSSAPKPLQDQGPPIWIAARDPASHKFAVENGCNVQVTPLGLGDEEVVSLMDRFNTACANAPEVPRPKIMVCRHLFTGETEAELEQAGRDLSRFYCTFDAWFKNQRPVDHGIIQPMTEADCATLPQYTPEKMRANNIVGTPDQVIARLKQYEAWGYDQFSYWIDTGMSHAVKKKALALFIDRVLPAFA